MKQGTMAPGLSVYLDLLRVTAAVVVFLSHLSWAKLSGGALWQIQRFGHDGVIVFFVLSGFVIQHVVSQKETTLGEYAIARLARLYSVVLPALLLTILCDWVGMAIRPEVYAMEQQTTPWLRIAAGVLFLSQSWGWNLELLSNNPFWSLPYEFWYYQIFGAAFFLRGKQRLAWVALGCLMAGPGILIYLPVWLAGVMACRASQQNALAPLRARLLYVLSATVMLGVILLEAKGIIVRQIADYLPQSFSPIDFVMAAAVALNLYAASSLALPLPRLARPVACVAGYTFALYLFHMPLLHLAATLVPGELPIALRAVVLALFTLGFVWLLGRVTERRKHVLASWLRGALRNKACTA